MVIKVFRNSKILHFFEVKSEFYLYSEQSVNSYNSESSVDPFIFDRSRFFQLPFPATRILSLYSDRSVNPYILAGTWIPIFLTDPWIPIFRAVHGSLYSEQSVDPYVLTVCESLYSGRSTDPYIQSGTRGILIMRMTHFLSLESIWLIPPSPFIH